MARCCAALGAALLFVLAQAARASGASASCTSAPSPELPAAWNFHALIQRSSGLSRHVSLEEWDDRSVLFHEGCPWLYEAHHANCDAGGPCLRTLECRMSQPLFIGAVALPAVAAVLALLAISRRPRESDLVKPINWGLNRLPCSLTGLVRYWFGSGLFPPAAATAGPPPAPELTVALYLVGLLGWLFLMHGVKYTQPTPLDVPEYLHLVAGACRSHGVACGRGSSPEKAGFKVVEDASGERWLSLPYPTSLVLGGRVSLHDPVPGDSWLGLQILTEVRLAAFAGILSTIFALLLSRLFKGSAVTMCRMIAAVGSSVFCLGFAALEATVRWHGHLWIAPAFANVGVAVFCIFLAAGVDASPFLARWAYYCTLVPLYFTAGAHKLKVGGLHWSACEQIRHWAEHEFHWNVPLPGVTRFLVDHYYMCTIFTVSTLALQMGIGVAELLPWLMRPLLPMAALSFHVGVWLMMHICFGGHAWVWLLCVDVAQPILRLFTGGTGGPKDVELPKNSPDSAGEDCHRGLYEEVRPKAAAAAAACTVGSIAFMARGLASTWVPWEDSEQWPFSNMDMFA